MTPIFRFRAAMVAVALLVSVPAYAQGTEEQTEACSGDAFTLCRGDIPDVAKITACMRVHKAQLSPKCRLVFDKSDAPAPAERPAQDAVERLVPKTTPPKTTMSKATASKTTASKTISPKATASKGSASKTGDHRASAIAVRPKPDARPASVAPGSLPARREPDPQVASTVAPAPAAPPPSSLPGLDSYRAGIVRSCDQGLIDPYTCRSTLEVLKGME